MRYPTLALASTVLLGVGLLPARIAAQNIEDAAPSALSGRVHIDLGANAPSKANAPAAALLLRAHKLRALTEQAATNLAAPGPVDCAMPVIKGDPKIDPDFSRPLPPDAASHTLIVIHVPRCPDRTR